MEVLLLLFTVTACVYLPLGLCFLLRPLFLFSDVRKTEDAQTSLWIDMCIFAFRCVGAVFVFAGYIASKAALFQERQSKMRLAKCYAAVLAIVGLSAANLVFTADVSDVKAKLMIHALWIVSVGLAISYAIAVKTKRGTPTHKQTDKHTHKQHHGCDDGCSDSDHTD
eukprot:GILJ01009694.1.p1 GENE.GILJ01009694.1~~GILJ01009694.1.p1  ORF type:complete len:167 (-),score=11.68 GILJ01009694.1:293-793(-)